MSSPVVAMLASMGVGVGVLGLAFGLPMMLMERASSRAMTTAIVVFVGLIFTCMAVLIAMENG